jgi:hypothetical protein
MVNRASPLRSHYRLTFDRPAKEIRKVIAMEKTGVWDGKTLPINKRALAKLFRSTGEFADLRSNETLWTIQQWQILLNNVKQIEDDCGPNGFNKHSLKLPRLGKNKIPWPWREDTCHEDVDMNFIFNEYSARLQRMNEFCNRNHTTQESAATLFLEHVVQWFENGGKCHLFGFMMMPYQTHPATYSFGRGILRQQKDGSTRPIYPGSRMQTGCMVLFPTDMKKEYDITRRTIVIESWRANSMRFKYAGGAKLIEMLEQVLLDLLDECKWYGPLQPLSKYPSVLLPRSYKNRRGWLKLLTGNSALTIADDDIEEPDIDDDEENAAYMEIDAQIKQIQNTGDVEKLQSLQDRDSADPTDPTDPADPADKGKGKAASTVVSDTAKAIEEWYQDNLAFFTNLPVPADMKDEVQSRLHLLKSIAHRDVHQDNTESQVERDHELARRLQQREYDTESRPQDPGPSRFPGSWDNVVTDPGVEDEDENPEYMMSGAL